MHYVVNVLCSLYNLRMQTTNETNPAKFQLNRFRGFGLWFENRHFPPLTTALRNNMLHECDNIFIINIKLIDYYCDRILFLMPDAYIMYAMVHSFVSVSILEGG